MPATYHLTASPAAGGACPHAEWTPEEGELVSAGRARMALCALALAPPDGLLHDMVGPATACCSRALASFGDRSEGRRRRRGVVRRALASQSGPGARRGIAVSLGPRALCHVGERVVSTRGRNSVRGVSLTEPAGVRRSGGRAPVLDERTRLLGLRVHDSARVVVFQGLRPRELGASTDDAAN